MDVLHEYLAPVLAQLRYPNLDEDIGNDDGDSEVTDLRREARQRKIAEYMNQLIADHEESMTNWELESEHRADLNDDPEPLPPPNLVTNEIAAVASSIRDLEIYLKCLVLLAHQRYGLEEVSQSELSRLTGSTRPTIARWLTDEQLAGRVAEIAHQQAQLTIAAPIKPTFEDRESAIAYGLLHWIAAQPPRQPAVTATPSTPDKESADAQQ